MDGQLRALLITAQMLLLLTGKCLLFSLSAIGLRYLSGCHGRDGSCHHVCFSCHCSPKCSGSDRRHRIYWTNGRLRSHRPPGRPRDYRTHRQHRVDRTNRTYRRHWCHRPRRTHWCNRIKGPQGRNWKSWCHRTSGYVNGAVSFYVLDSSEI